MKSLLLTLVVMTIVCLDLGYTNVCYTHESANPKTSVLCGYGTIFCYKSSWIYRGVEKIERGCASACPDMKPNGKYIYCCTRDECND
uniref:Short-chain three finger toxin isoform 1 n=1 Tax=Bungarus flaviceps TaxID=8614 RepID=D5J9N8_9SAUR|nr:short-chain three finger toxin isoform 1 [Bungarus flaviceps]